MPELLSINEDDLRERCRGISDLFDSRYLLPYDVNRCFSFLCDTAERLSHHYSIGLMVALVLAEFSFLTVMVRYLSKRRRRLLEHAGTKWGAGMVSELQWNGWPHLKTWLSLIFIAGTSFCFNLYLTWMVNRAVTGATPLFSLVLGLQNIFIIPLYLFLVAKLFCGVWWRVYPNTIEFFENGICCNFARWYEWKEVETRQSAIYNDRIVAVFVPLPPFDWQITEKHLATTPRQQHVVRLDAKLKARILDACSHQPSSR